ncbi:hypothetical protein COCON_G00219840 [Conger conger]|uniref:Uncharacterized protein n=1 Tax=Conger conger TaxID=82655 RepID=A0A9Q1CYB1_CONCO|nr:hypothetical protein COCON_G00219840 [Conger conger]
MSDTDEHLTGEPHGAGRTFPPEKTQGTRAKLEGTEALLFSLTQAVPSEFVVRHTAHKRELAQQSQLGRVGKMNRGALGFKQNCAWEACTTSNRQCRCCGAASAGAQNSH